MDEGVVLLVSAVAEASVVAVIVVPLMQGTTIE
jgi:hypothetical protein